MENIVASRLKSVRFGEVQCFKNIAILPLIAPEGTFGYCTLGEALATSDIRITEVSDSGSVPELLVINRGKTPVLLIDGEELAGAKQNRVLNTSILVNAISETRIPVSCTEQGRWAHTSPSFSESGNVMSQKLRAKKSSSVSDSLEASAGYHADQGEVWSGIAHLDKLFNCTSPTSAMDDVFKSREEDFQRCAEVFRCVPGQVGLFAFSGGRPAGFDLVSLESAYAKIHAKLVRSYVLESLLESAGSDMPAPDHAAIAGEFLNRVTACAESRFPSVGCGSDVRFRGEALAGAAVIHADEVIHSAFFQLDTTGHADADHMASLRHRRRNYRG